MLTNYLTKNVFASTLLTLLVMIGSVSLAQEQADDTQGSTDQAAETTKPSDAEKDSERNKKPPREVFKPTEEISEDSPVPFPVDI